MTWNATAPGALDLEHLRSAAALLPRSDVALVGAFVALTTTSSSSGRGRAALSPTGLAVVREGYVMLAEALMDTMEMPPPASLPSRDHWNRLLVDPRLRNRVVSWLWLSLRVGYHFHAPTLAMHPQPLRKVMLGYETFLEGVGRVPPYTPRPMISVLAEEGLSTGTSCPLNKADSCFVDTALVVMFIATDAYDAITMADSPGDRPTPRQKFVMGDIADFDSDWCTNFALAQADALANSVERRTVRDLTRRIAWNMRRGDMTNETVQDVQRLRAALDACIPRSADDQPLTERQEEARFLYEVLVGVTGWGRHFIVMPVSVSATTAIDNVHLKTPLPRQFRTEVTLLGGLSMPLRFDHSAPAGEPVALQRLVDAAVSGVRTERSDAPLHGSIVDGVLRHALQPPVQTEVFEYILSQRETFAGSSDVTLSLTSQETVYLPMVPPSGVMVFEATTLKVDGAQLLFDLDRQDVLLDFNDRDVSVSVTEPGQSERRVPYRVFAVICKGGEPGSGHFWCHFWTDDDVDDDDAGSRSVHYRYDDNAEVNPLTRVDTPEEIANAVREVSELGYFFFCKAR